MFGIRNFLNRKKMKQIKTGTHFLLFQKFCDTRKTPQIYCIMSDRIPSKFIYTTKCATYVVKHMWHTFAVKYFRDI